MWYEIIELHEKLPALIELGKVAVLTGSDRHYGNPDVGQDRQTL